MYTSYYLRRNDDRVWVSGFPLGFISPTEQLFNSEFKTDYLDLYGMVYHCDELSGFFYGSNKGDLRAIVETPDLSEVIIEAWVSEDKLIHTFEHFIRLYNVIPGNVKHGDCSCGGAITIQFDKFEVLEANKRQVILKEASWLNPKYLKESDLNEIKTILNEK